MSASATNQTERDGIPFAVVRDIISAELLFLTQFQNEVERRVREELGLPDPNPTSPAVARIMAKGSLRVAEITAERMINNTDTASGCTVEEVEQIFSDEEVKVVVLEQTGKQTIDPEQLAKLIARHKQSTVNAINAMISDVFDAPEERWQNVKTIVALCAEQGIAHDVFLARTDWHDQFLRRTHTPESYRTLTTDRLCTRRVLAEEYFDGPYKNEVRALIDETEQAMIAAGGAQRSDKDFKEWFVNQQVKQNKLVSALATVHALTVVEEAIQRIWNTN